MEFKDLSSDIQSVAADTLASVLKDLGAEIKSEPAKELARCLNAAFIELHSPSEHAFAHHDNGQASG